MKKKRSLRPKHIVKDSTAGSLVEYGLIIGFSIVIFMIIVGIMTSIMEWSKGNLADFFSIFQG